MIRNVLRTISKRLLCDISDIPTDSCR